MRTLQYIRKSVKQKICNGKVMSFLLLMLIVSMDYNRPIRKFVEQMDYPVSWCTFPFLMAGFTFLTLFWFGIIYVNSDIPFFQHNNMYHVIRTGRTVWGIGQISGIVIRSILLVMGTALCSILSLLPRIEWSNEWGKLLHTAALQGVDTANNFRYIIYYGILQKYTPLELFALTVIITALSASFMGVMMFVICLYSNRAIAVAGTAASTILLYWVLNAMPAARYKISYLAPAVWPQVARSTTPYYGYYWFPPIPYIITFLVLGIAVMSVMILVRLQRCELNWENEDM